MEMWLTRDQDGWKLWYLWPLFDTDKQLWGRTDHGDNAVKIAGYLMPNVLGIDLPIGEKGIGKIRITAHTVLF